MYPILLDVISVPLDVEPTTVPEPVYTTIHMPVSSLLFVSIGLIFIGMIIFAFVLWRSTKKKDRGDEE